MNQDQRLAAVVSMVLMMATASLGWLTVRDQLTLPRIQNVGATTSTPTSEQDVVARLWEDPLQAVQAAVARRGSNDTHTPEAFKQLVLRKLENARVCMMVVGIPGTSFPDDGELRLRQRYSLEMALAQSGYQPDGDGRHLGYVQLRSVGAQRVHYVSGSETNCSMAEGFIPSVTNFNQLPVDGGGKLVEVPYEWFVSKESARISVVVLWLQNEFLNFEPLCRLAYLRKTLNPELPATNYCGMFFIGPDYSGALGDIVEDAKRLVGLKEPHMCANLLSNQLCILSPEATAPDALLGLDPSTNWLDARSHLDSKLRMALGGADDWRYFQNFIAPDDQLTDLLARELKLRNINVQNGDDRILVLSEADTSYGRALPLSLTASMDSLDAFDTYSSRTATNLTSFLSPRWKSNLVTARYLQGLDGHRGFQDQTKSAGKGTAGKTPAEMLEQAMHKQVATAVGDSQIDYSERLAKYLSEKETKATVKAVGVLGSDVYDKLILLRSLRKQFPQALFFTTDLDARLWHPDHLLFTRNLIVASAYPVEVMNLESDGFQMAPFRNSYQVAVFNAVCAALRIATNSRATIEAVPPPQIYEIGRHGPVRLETVKSPADLTNSFTAHVASSFNSIVSRLSERTILGILPAMAFPVIGAWVFLSRRKQEHSPIAEMRLADIFGCRTAWLGWFVVAGVLIPAIPVIVLTEQMPNAGIEPWFWLKGISVWPTEIVRLLIVFAVVWMLLCAWQRYKRHGDTLREEFFASDDPVPSSNCPGNHINAHDVWKWYSDKATMRKRYCRVVPTALAYFLIGFGLMSVTGLPLNTHIRGGFAHGLDFWITCISVGALLILLFYVLDAVWLSAKMLKRLADPFTCWNAKLVDKSANSFGVIGRDVEGFLDVRFAALKTEECGKLIFLPFVVQFLMLLSRNAHFDNWKWPPALVVILVCNVLLAGLAWLLLRHAAGKIKSEALRKLCQTVLSVEQEIAKDASGCPLAKARKIGLLEIKLQIEGEHRGAFSKWVQDPALVAVLIPTGLLGIVTVLIQSLFG